MKGLIIIPAYFPDIKRGGSVAGCRRFAKSISLKHSIEICTLDTTYKGSRIAKVDNVKVNYFKINKGLEWLSDSGWGLSYQFSVWFLKNYKNYDYIYIRSLWNFLSLFASFVCILTGKKYIISSSGKFSRYALKRSIVKKLISSPLVLILIKKSIFIHYTTKYEFENTPKFISKLTNSLILNTSIDILPNNAFKRNNKLNFNKNLIYTVSRFDEIKRIELLSKVVNQINNDFDIVHIGDYKENLKYFKKISNYYKKIKINFDLRNIYKSKESQRIFFPGYLNIKNVNKLNENYQNSIFVQMSYSEGQSNSILEAMARGSICLISEGCNMETAYKQNALLITDEENLANDINRILINEELRKNIIRNQRFYLEKYHSAEKIAEEFNAAITKFI